MVEEKKPETLSEALGQPDLSVKDISGKAHRLWPLRLRDLAELERTVGSFDEWSTSGARISTWLTVIWLAVRRNDRTAAQIRASQWAVTLADVGDMFGADQGGYVSEKAAEVLKANGLGPQARPTEEAEDGAPASSGAMPSVPVSPLA